MKKSGQNIIDFIKSYDKINYCEGILYPDGTIEEAIPSHLIKLCEIYDNTKGMKEIEKEIPIDVLPLDWLLCKCNCVAVYYRTIIINDHYQQLTREQKNSLRLLNAQQVINIPNLEDIFNEFQNNYDNFQNLLKKSYNEDRIKEINNNMHIN